MSNRDDPPERFRDAADRLHETVAARTGLADFGAGDYLPGLHALLQSMDYDPRFTEHGRRAAWGQVAGALGSRAQAVASMKAHPDHAAVRIDSPVVITGIPRTGTTALHQLLAVDERFQGLQTWLLDAPMPRPPQESWPDHPQFRATAERLERRHCDAPVKKAAHAMAAEQVDECCLLLWQGFVSNLWTCGWSAASYDAWWQCQSEAPAYAHYRACVQLIGSGDPGRRWLLKNPGHIANLDLLFAVFPDARVIQTHRDPARAVPSLVSLLMGAHRVMEQGREKQRAAIMLRREVAKWSDAVRRAEAVRARFPGRLLDVVHADFHRDPMREVDRIYAFIGTDLPDATRAAMTERSRSRPELAHGAHRYRIEDYGMTQEEARAPFGDYLARYDLVEQRR